MDLILASSSPYRRDLLQRLGLPFRQIAPAIDEGPQPGEDPQALVCRLSQEKAAAVATTHPQSWIIAADQLAVCGGSILGKPGTTERAIEQLLTLQGKDVDFLNGLTLHTPTGTQTRLVPYRVTFRSLDAAAIERYVTQDQPLDCAGAFRSEALGIALVERMTGEDPNALMGLPLIALVKMMHAAGHLLP